MGDPKKRRKKYTKPRKRWDKKRIEDERKIIDFYGLRNKKELRRVEAILRKKRTTAKKLLAAEPEVKERGEKILLNSLRNLGVLKGEVHLDDVLGLGTQEFLERRLQTIVWRKDLSRTVKQARQFIVHGHIAIGDRKMNCPGYIVPAEEESKIKYFGKPMVLETAPKAQRKKQLKKKFEEVKGAEDTKDKKGGKAREVKDEKTEKPKKDSENTEKGAAGDGAKGKDSGDKKVSADG